MASHRRPARPLRGTRATLATAATAAAVLSAAAPVGAAPPDEPSGRIARARELYERAEAVTEQYDGAQETRARLIRQVRALQDRLASTQRDVNRLRAGLGAVAAARYQDGGLDPSVGLLLSPDPGAFLDRMTALERIARGRGRRMRLLRDAERAMRQSRALAAERLAELDHARAVLAARKRTVQRTLEEAQRLLSGLGPAGPSVPGLAGGGPGTAAAPVTGPLQQAAPSARAAQAVAAVRSVLGAPYEWGSAGPGAFDCSGLMWWAYQRAGVTLPRTSQGQLRAGRRIPPARARPGDLVIYRDDASHVGMYVGGGRVIHAPYPGARVRYDRVDMLPIAAVTRV